MNHPVNNIPYILDTTLRDGSYLNNFQIDSVMTYQVVRALSDAGVPYIETGHGLGLGANRYPEWMGACSDEEWMQASAAGCGPYKWGMFFIPGIGTKDDMRLAREHNMHFVRIGIEPDDWHKAMPYITFAAMTLGMEVYLNIMKSHLAQPDYLSEIADAAHANGADGLYIVDSAGHMIPKDVKRYVETIRTTSDIPRIGFHGHNNLQMAVSNTMEGFLAGASMLDVTLRGIGRSAGNCQAESLLILMHRLGYLNHIQLRPLAMLAEREIDPMVKKWEATSTESLLCGKNALHSSYLDIIRQYASDNAIDEYEFIDKVGIVALSAGWKRITKSKLQEVHQMMQSWK